MRFCLRNIIIVVLISLSGYQHASAQYDKDVFMMRGRSALADGKYASAIEQFNILAQLDTSDYWTFFFRGIAKYNLGDIRGAKIDFDRSVRINPVFTSGYHYRGITQSRYGNYDAALMDFQKAIDLRPGNIGLYFSRGVTYFLSQQFEKAIKDFDKYIRKEPKDPSAYLNRGASYLFLGDTLKAMTDYDKAIKLDRFDPEGYVRRGRLYASQERFEEAISDMDVAIGLDTTNTYAYFNRALMQYECENYREAMDDLNKVLEMEPGNALTLYNRALLNAHVMAYEDALDDLDRVLMVNPENVLAYFNRAAIFIELGMYRNALEDYDRAIELYPDFVKAYINRSYVKRMLGEYRSAKKDYDIAQKKIKEFRAKNMSEPGSLADTTKSFTSLLSLDAEFAKKDFDDELLQHRDVDVKLRPLYKFVLTSEKDNTNYALDRGYKNPLISKFEESLPCDVALQNENEVMEDKSLAAVEEAAWSGSSAEHFFTRALYEYVNKQFNSSQNYYAEALDESEAKEDIHGLYSAFYHMNRGVLRAEMIEFISSIENNVQVLSMDDKGSTRARVKDQVSIQYDYTDAIEDMEAAARTVDDIPYFYYNLGNLYCLSSEHVRSIENYNKAIELYPYMGDAFFNRGLVLIYLNDKEKGCMDLSRAGELGVADAYGIIKKYCEENND